MSARLLLLGCALTACATAPLRIEQAVAPDGMNARLAALHVPAVSVAVIHRGELAWARAWGTADVDTPFQAASVGKWVTAFAALQAVERGEVSLDGDVNASLRSWQLPTPTPVTLQQLLSHSAGVNLQSVPGYAYGQPLPTLLQILNGAPPATNAPIRVEGTPGVFAYSGGGSTVVQQLLEDVTQQRFDRLLDARLFTPLALRHTTFALPDDTFLASAARSVDEHGAPQPLLVNPESSAAGLWSTPTELARLFIEAQRALAGRSKLLSAESARRLVTPVVSVATAEENDGVAVSMALGSFVEQRDGVVYFGHDGKNDGFLTIARATQDGEGVVVMSNGAAAAPLMLELIGAIARTYGWRGWK